MPITFNNGYLYLNNEVIKPNLMAKKDNLTVYQKLFTMFGTGNGPRTPKYTFDKTDLITTKSREEYEKEKLEGQQQHHMKAQWARVDNELYQKAVYYETSRIASYMDYEAMEFTPEISAALDIMSEESCLVGSTVIPLLNGGEKSIESLYNDGYTDFWVYSYNPNTHEFVPGKVDKVIFKGNKKTIKLTLDDGSIIESTHDHKFLVNGEWVECKDISIGSSLNSIYRRVDKNGYEEVCTKDSKFKKTHRLVANKVLHKDKLSLSENNDKNEVLIIHHDSFNKLNNDPNHLKWMYWSDHTKLHNDLNSERWTDKNFSEKMRNIFSKNAKSLWKRDGFKEKIIQSRINSVKKLSQKERNLKFGNLGDKNGMYGVSRYGSDNPNYNNNINRLDDIDINSWLLDILNNVSFNDLCKKYKTNTTVGREINKILLSKYGGNRQEDLIITANNSLNIESVRKKLFNLIDGGLNPKRNLNKILNELNIDYFTFTKFLNKNKYKKWGDFVDSCNHRVVKVEISNTLKPVYDLVNVGEHDNFGVKCNDGMIISHNCTLNEQGKVITVRSESKRIKNVLEDLFENILDVNTNLQMWTRNTCKYGDNFVYLKIDRSKGVLGSSQLTNVEIERDEIGGMTPHTQMDVDNQVKKKEVKFTWKEKSMDFNAWEIAHFRLLGDDRKLPYGTSVLEKVRRIWKQLLLAEDAMLVYRVVRAPERRVFKVYVGNIDDEDVESYVQKVANKFKRTQQADNDTGQVDLRYNTFSC